MRRLLYKSERWVGGERYSQIRMYIVKLFFKPTQRLFLKVYFMHLKEEIL